VATGRSVTLLLGVEDIGSVYPASLFPDEVEYVVATTDGSLGHRGSVTELVPEYEAWADQCFAAGSADVLETMAGLARGRDGRLGVARLGSRKRRPQPRSSVDRRRRSWLQVMLTLDVSCALGVCLGCSRDGSEGPVRVCREGPAFAADELAWERRP
jgi:NAD(P)H-flavin reductase